MANETAELITATWGLVVATILLVAAAAIPAIQAILNIWTERRRLASMTVPEIHILRDRVNKWAEQLLGNDPLSKADFEEWVHTTEHDLEILGRIADASPQFGIKFTNELYVCRHLLTQARTELKHGATISEKPVSEEIARTKHDCKMRSVRLFLAAELTLDQMDKLVPEWTQSIDGESFGKRFKRLSEEREAEAERKLVDFRREKRPRKEE